MPLARINQKILHFVHIPKTGGSSVERYLKQHGPICMVANQTRQWSRCTPQHIHADIYKVIFSDSFADDAFCIVRDPIERAISEYRYRISLNQSVPPFETWLRRSFRDFKTKPYVLDNHIRPQIDFVSDNVRVFKFENGLESVFEWVSEITQTKYLKQDFWQKKNSAPRPHVSQASSEMIREFYAADFKLHSSIADGGSKFTGAQIQELMKQ